MLPPVLTFYASFCQTSEKQKIQKKNLAPNSPLDKWGKGLYNLVIFTTVPIRRI